MKRATDSGAFRKFKQRDSDALPFVYLKFYVSHSYF
jgi:hypothetical protein